MKDESKQGVGAWQCQAPEAEGGLIDGLGAIA